MSQENQGSPSPNWDKTNEQLKRGAKGLPTGPLPSREQLSRDQEEDRTNKPFSNGHWSKTVRTVGEMITELQRLNPEMPVQVGIGSDSADLVVFNRGCEREHLAIGDGGEWDPTE